MWFSDLRGSTPLAEASTKPEFLLTLNDYFEVTAGAVIACGGEVLRFIGDAVLAIFPIDDSVTAEAAAKAAVAALYQADKRLIAVNERRQNKGKPDIAFGAGLHIGKVLYGNIGVPERIEFSVIGADANEAARIESLTKPHDCNALASKAFVELAPEGWKSVGDHALRGVGDEIEIFALSEGQVTQKTAGA
ncbi:MAG: adenylate/guanylate cyclase domain-containing protein [Pseudomonadota bacterium]|nr:adenylate/guanylate cyclase domain-containing protein [Pseudomonadota bacterium]